MKIIFEHSHCAANCVNYELARLARRSCEKVWLNDPPDSIVVLSLAGVTMILGK
jgi:hypothetical protein